MHIALVTPEFVTEPDCFDGGLANYVHRLSLSLLQCGHKPIVFVSSHSAEVLQHNMIEVHRLAIKNTFNATENEYLFCIYQSYMLNQYLKQYTEHQHIDIIQYTSLAAVGLFRLPNIPAVIRLSAYIPLWDSNQYKESTDIRNNIYATEELAMLAADAIYSPSQLIASVVQRKLNTEVKVIEPPFVQDVASADTTIYNQHLIGKKYALYFGTIHIHKGMLTLVRTVYSFFEQYPDYYFVFVGKQYTHEGKPLVEHLKAAAREFAPRLIHLPKLPHEQLYPVIAQAEFVVLPSWIDNFPNTCIEAMALGKIVIGTREASFSQMITDGISGFLFGRDNETELLQTIERVQQLTQTERATIGRNARKRIQQMSPENSVPLLINYYQNAIDTFVPQQTSLEYHNNLINTVLTAYIEIDKLAGHYKKRSIESQNTIETILQSKTYRIGKKIVDFLRKFS